MHIQDIHRGTHDVHSHGAHPRGVDGYSDFKERILMSKGARHADIMVMHVPPNSFLVEKPALPAPYRRE